MAYYSFYRIIKDIIFTIIHNRKLRLLVTFLFIFFILFLFSKNKVSASSSLELKDGTIVLPTWIDGSTYNAFIFQSAKDENGKYNFVTVFTRGSGTLKLGTYNSVTSFTNTGNGLSLQNRSNKTTVFNGSVSEYQTYLNTNFGWSSGSTANSSLYWATWLTYTNLSNYGVDPENCYINCTANILNADNSVYLPSNSLYVPDTLQEYPIITNTMQELQELNYEYLQINARSYYNKRFYLDVYNLKGFTAEQISLYQYAMGRKNRILLTPDSPYYNSDLSSDTEAIYWIPISDLNLVWERDVSYRFEFVSSTLENPGSDDELEYLEIIGDPITFSLSSNVTNDRIKSLNDSIYYDINNNINNINNDLFNTTIGDDTSQDINNSLNFNNQNENLNNLNGGFFSRLTSMLSILIGYDLSQDTVISIPLPHSENTIELHSKMTYDYVTGGLRLIINAFWFYIFTFYMWKFLNKIYIAVATGNILDTFSTSGEAITNNML